MFNKYSASYLPLLNSVESKFRSENLNVLELFSKFAIICCFGSNFNIFICAVVVAVGKVK